MLVLSRKTQESVVVGGSENSEPTMIVTVLEIRGGRVRLGFSVAKEVPVHRQEVWERLREGEPPKK
jgi:carbon storage regulator